jgi:hypothetical protein
LGDRPEGGGPRVNTHSQCPQFFAAARSCYLGRRRKGLVMRNIRSIFAVLGVCVVASMAVEGAQAAPSICKGLEKSACEINGSCSWVRSYKTSKGKQVSAFCRKKPERKKSTEAAPPPKGS